MVNLYPGPNDVVLTLREKRTDPLSVVMFQVTDAAGRSLFFLAPLTESTPRFDAYTWTLVADPGDEDLETGKLFLKQGTYTYRAYQDEVSIPQTLVLDGHEGLLEVGRAVVHATDESETYDAGNAPGVFYRP